MKEVVNCEDRLKNMLIIDKSENTSKIERVVKAEIVYVLKNYFEIKAEDVDINIAINEKGRYVLNLLCESRNIKVCKSL